MLSPWMTMEIKRAINLKNNNYILIKAAHTSKNITQTLWDCLWNQQTKLWTTNVSQSHDNAEAIFSMHWDKKKKDNKIDPLMDNMCLLTHDSIHMGEIPNKNLAIASSICHTKTVTKGRVPARMITLLECHTAYKRCSDVLETPCIKKTAVSNKLSQKLLKELK